MTEPRPAVFLDRDGTLIEERDFLADPDELVLQPGAGPALARLAAAGFALVCATNQSGVARGYFDEGAVARVHARLVDELTAAGAALDLILYAPSHPDLPLRPGWDPTWRKPGPGMFLTAAARLGLDLARSWSVGDALRDLEGARAAGVHGHVLVRTGHGARTLETLGGDPPAWVRVAEDLVGAVDLILAAPDAQGR